MPSSGFDFDVITGPSVPRPAPQPAPPTGASATAMTRHVDTTGLARLPDRAGADLSRRGGARRCRGGTLRRRRR